VAARCRLISTLVRWGPSGVVSDERLRAGDVDHDETLVLLDHAFKTGCLVSGEKHEAVVLGANGLVFRDGHLNHAGAGTTSGAALA
jgi:hypothetical protein